ncbi:Uncharacterised protein [Mycobacteroides abscessus subsp. abscessus]|nr:Uncharacterised protein [Mycobacteroides abscessus subsp. abscessus]
MDIPIDGEPDLDMVAGQFDRAHGPDIDSGDTDFVTRPSSAGYPEIRGVGLLAEGQDIHHSGGDERDHGDYDSGDTPAHMRGRIPAIGHPPACCANALRHRRFHRHTTKFWPASIEAPIPGSGSSPAEQLTVGAAPAAGTARFNPLIKDGTRPRIDTS